MAARGERGVWAAVSPSGDVWSVHSSELKALREAVEIGGRAVFWPFDSKKPKTTPEVADLSKKREQVSS